MGGERGLGAAGCLPLSLARGLRETVADGLGCGIRPRRRACLVWIGGRRPRSSSGVCGRGRRPDSACAASVLHGCPLPLSLVWGSYAGGLFGEVSDCFFGSGSTSEGSPSDRHDNNDDNVNGPKAGGVHLGRPQPLPRRQVSCCFSGTWAASSYSPWFRASGRWTYTGTTAARAAPQDKSFGRVMWARPPWPASSPSPG